MLELKIFEAYISKNEILQRTLYYFTYISKLENQYFRLKIKSWSNSRQRFLYEYA